MIPLERLVAEAQLAPSTHNSQPARWSREGETITLWGDEERRLEASDPGDRDFAISCGAAVEGTVLALARRGQGAQVTELWGAVGHRGMRPVAQIVPGGPPNPSDAALAETVADRTTQRAGFGDVEDVLAQRLARWAETEPHVTLVTGAKPVARIARLVDVASARLLMQGSVRKELLEWMRLDPGVRNYHRDGMNLEALAMDAGLAKLVAPVLGTRMFEVLAALGLGPALSGEAKRTREAHGILLMHWPEGRSWVGAGRYLYRTWLKATQMGLAGWPAAALADDKRTAAWITKTYLGPDQRLFNALRLGRAKGPAPSRSRLDPAEVILDRA